MAPKRWMSADFNSRRQKEGWTRVEELSDFQAFANFTNYTGNASHKRFGTFVMAQVKKASPEIEREARAAGGAIALFLDEGAAQNFVSLASKANDVVLVWAFEKGEADAGSGPAPALDGPACLARLGVLAVGARQGVHLPIPAQEDKAFMWKAPSFHPLQTLENVYQRVVRKAGYEAEADAIQAQSDALSRYFIQEPGDPACFESKPLDKFEGDHLAAVRMNHLIDSFYLFRLLVHYRVESESPISEELRVELSGDLTKLLHNGDRTRMKWLSDWLTKKIAALGQMIEQLNAGGAKRAIFFLKGGRALNYFLQTPEKGENDWDTQVVINPSLSAEEWYRCFSEVHDTMLVALKTFKTEFTELVKQNAASFSEYLKTASAKAAAPVDDEEQDENEVGDVKSRTEHANCKAELIDIGVPRRDSASALEEWTHLSGPESLLQADGVIFPHREYYLNEYLMMIRDAFLPEAEVRKAPKRIARLGLILASDRGRIGGPNLVEKKGLRALPETAEVVLGIPDKGKQELLGVIVSQFVEAYNLHQDRELAAYFDKECAAMIAAPPPLPAGLGDLLDDGQKATAGIVGIAHSLSARMDEHWESRNKFFEDQLPFFADFVRSLARETQAGLQRVRSQFAVAGSYAARLHAGHLRLNPYGLEPIRRILVKLQCAKGRSLGEVMNAVRDDIKNAAMASQKFTVTELDEGNDKQSLLLFWSRRVQIGNYNYAPLAMKIRVAEQSGDALPVLSSIDGIPVLDPRYLVADYLKKTSKIDERGSRLVLASATAAVSEMLSRFDIESDDPA